MDRQYDPIICSEWALAMSAMNFYHQYNEMTQFPIFQFLDA